MRTYALKALALLFAATAVVEAGLLWLSRAPFPVPEARPVQTWAADVSPVDASPESAGSASDFDSLDSRPLFAPTRRPFVAPPAEEPQVAEAPPEPEPAPDPVPEPVAEPEPAPAAAPTVDPSGFQLKGIMIAGQKRSSLIATPENSAGQWFAPGAVVMGWTIAEISDNQLTLTQGQQSHVLKQYVDNPQTPLGGQTPAE